MNIDNLKISDLLKKELKLTILSRKTTVLYGYFNSEFEKKTRLQKIEAKAARDYKALELERFCMRRGSLVLLGADRQSFTHKEFRILDKALCMYHKGRIVKKSQVARSMLAKLINGSKVDWHSTELVAGGFNYAPFFYKRAVIDNAIMIDLSRAHFSIYSRLSWDLRLLFDGDKFEGFRNGKIKFNSISKDTDKTILQRIYGAFASQSFKFWDGIENEKVTLVDEMKGYKNELYSPTLVFGLMQTLHNIAAVAVKSKCFYIYVDSYMFKKGEEKPFCDFLDSIGLRYKIEKVGNAEIFGYNRYKIGGKEVGFGYEIDERKLYNNDIKEKKRSSAFSKVIKEVFDDDLVYFNNNIDYTAVNFLTGLDLLNSQYDLTKK